MIAVIARARAELRSTWRSWLALGLLLGVAGGVAIAAVAGARRTASAYPRFVAWSHAADVESGGFPDSVDAGPALSTMEHVPSVAAWARVDVVAYGATLPDGAHLTIPQLFAAADQQNRFLRTIDRAKVLAGRMFDPSHPDEAVADFGLAQQYRLHVGDVVRLDAGPRIGDTAPTVPVRIVGIVAEARLFPAFGAGNAFFVLVTSPSFAAAHHVTPAPSDASVELQLKRGQAGIPDFLREMRGAGLGGVDLPFVQAVRTAGVQRSTRVESGALWALGAVVVLAAGAILGQAVARQTYLASAELPVLRAIGMSRWQLFELGIVRMLPWAVLGSATSVLIAGLVSPLTPIGLARIAEPHPGFAVDGLVMGLGAVGVVLVSLLIAAVPAWRATGRAAVRDDDRQDLHTSTLAGLAARRAASPAVGVGVRMALEPGRGRTAVPVRSAIFGATLATATLVASLIFWSSLDHLVTTPRLSGYAWDMFTAVPEESPGHVVAGGAAAIESVLRSDPAVAGFSRGGFVNMQVAGKSVFAVITGGSGPASPIIADGRAPSGPREIALGRASMTEAGVTIGQNVMVSAVDADHQTPTRAMRVVGEAIIPAAPFGDTPVGEGGVITLDGAEYLDPATLGNERAVATGLPFLIRFRPGVDSAGAFARLQAKFPPNSFSVASQHRGDITTLGRITRVPLALALLLGLIALGTLAQTLVTSVRARRRDLAVLKALGFSRTQVRAAIAWQASALVVVALVVGLPVGILAGRWVWRVFADGIYVVPAPTFSLLAIACVVPATLIVANLIAAFPARTAARTRPAVVLRSE